MEEEAIEVDDVTAAPKEKEEPAFFSAVGSSLQAGGAPDDAPQFGRSTADHDDDDPSGINFVDHFSLYTPSSTVKFRNARVHVYESPSDQFLLEDRRPETGGRHTLTVKRMVTVNFGMRILRLVYTLVAILVGGHYFVFCFQMILYLFLQLPVHAGRGGHQQNIPEFIGAILALPMLLFGMASLMAFTTAFIVDTWSGGRLLRAIMGWSAVLIEVLYFTVFLGVPCLAIIILLLSRSPLLWESSCLVWFICVSIAFIVFAAAVFWREISSCYKLVAIHHGDEGPEDETKSHRFWRLAGRCVLHSQTMRFSGLREERYFVSGEDEQPVEGYNASPEYSPVQTWMTPYSFLVSRGCCNTAFVKLEHPRRLFTTNEVRDILPFITKHSWSLEAMWCRNNRSRMIAAAKGPAALDTKQMKSSVACNVIGAVMVFLGVLGALVWIEAGVLLDTLVGIFCIILCVFPMIHSSLRMNKMYRDINNDVGMFDALVMDKEGIAGGKKKLTAMLRVRPTAKQDESPLVGDSEDDKEQNKDAFGDEESPDADAITLTRAKPEERATMFQVWETIKVTEPKPWYCWTRVFLEVSFLFLWPLASIYSAGNGRMGTVFLIICAFSFLRIYFDAAAVLSELGSLSDVDVLRNDDEMPRWRSILGRNANKNERALVAKARLAEIIGKISKSGVAVRWTWAFAVLVIGIFVMFVAALGTGDTDPENRPEIRFASDFYYPPQEGLAYPTCAMTKGFTLPGGRTTALYDYAFFSALSYEEPETTEKIMAEWFGPGEVVDEWEFVKEWRETAPNGNPQSPVYFKLFSFPNYPGIGLIAVRGSQTMWDWLINMQLWSAAAFTQLVKWFSPLGWVWTPILDKLVTAASWIESEGLREIHYYRITTAFVNDVLAGWGGSDYEALRITGVSLGGGIAIITGAQTEARAVAISGMGGELSRNTFDPPLTLEALNNNVFNWIPDRDLIARIGGNSNLIQKAKCTAEANDLFGCHSFWRSICEISYRCGTGGRPVVCDCVQNFHYPLPVQNGTRTFEEACPPKSK